MNGDGVVDFIGYSNIIIMLDLLNFVYFFDGKFIFEVSVFYIDGDRYVLFEEVCVVFFDKESLLFCELLLDKIIY